LAQGVFGVTRCRSAHLLTRSDSDYLLACAVTRFSVIVPRTGRGVVAAFPGSGELKGVDVETFPGGGEPSAVKSDVCSASVFAIGTGLTTRFFMSMTSAVTRNAACRSVHDHRLSPDAHDVHHNGLAGSTFCSASIGSGTRTSDQSRAQEQTAALRRGTGSRTPTLGQASEQP
jgi:hypothetical protein